MSRTTDTPDASTERRDAILQAATTVFLRYGFRKTSMDDVARAANLSRQGLYLHFANKEELFKAAALHLAATSRALHQAALERTDLDLEERLVGAFLAIYRHETIGVDHLAELFATARQLVGPSLVEAEQTLVQDLARALGKLGVAAAWKDHGLSAKDLAQHLWAASHGSKAEVASVNEYRDRMRIAVRLVCRPVRR